MLRATGLRSLNYSGDNPWCTCEVRSSGFYLRRQRVSTRAAAHTLDPVWEDELHELERWCVGDDLEFTVYNQGLLGSRKAGSAVLLSEQFYPHGFEGDLPLSGSAASVLRVRVRPEDMTAESKERNEDKRRTLVSGLVPGLLTKKMSLQPALPSATTQTSPSPMCTLGVDCSQLDTACGGKAATAADAKAAAPAPFFPGSTALPSLTTKAISFQLPLQKGEETTGSCGGNGTPSTTACRIPSTGKFSRGGFTAAATPKIGGRSASVWSVTTDPEMPSLIPAETPGGPMQQFEEESGAIAGRVPRGNLLAEDLEESDFAAWVEREDKSASGTRHDS
eukprot:TRINITY_DN28619_c0_g1_i1.p1 TRINITY_DN28619_c0_g1~~TRINITY_DN28619_c0_g1_i1.p1  ORF type:complete len:335 (-),score=55.70 TRINITY_DN28619_c0_g1_i1:232-1236(-)